MRRESLESSSRVIRLIPERNLSLKGKGENPEQFANVLVEIKPVALLESKQTSAWLDGMPLSRDEADVENSLLEPQYPEELLLGEQSSPDLRPLFGGATHARPQLERAWELRAQARPQEVFAIDKRAENPEVRSDAVNELVSNATLDEPSAPLPAREKDAKAEGSSQHAVLRALFANEDRAEHPGIRFGAANEQPHTSGRRQSAEPPVSAGGNQSEKVSMRRGDSRVVHALPNTGLFGDVPQLIARETPAMRASLRKESHTSRTRRDVVDRLDLPQEAPVAEGEVRHGAIRSNTGETPRATKGPDHLACVRHPEFAAQQSVAPGVLTWEGVRDESAAATDERVPQTAQKPNELRADLSRPASSSVTEFVLETIPPFEPASSGTRMEEPWQVVTARRQRVQGERVAEPLRGFRVSSVQFDALSPAADHTSVSSAEVTARFISPIETVRAGLREGDAVSPTSVFQRTSIVAPVSTGVTLLASSRGETVRAAVANDLAVVPEAFVNEHQGKQVPEPPTSRVKIADGPALKVEFTPQRASASTVQLGDRGNTYLQPGQFIGGALEDRAAFPSEFKPDTRMRAKDAFAGAKAERQILDDERAIGSWSEAAPGLKTEKTNAVADVNSGSKPGNGLATAMPSHPTVQAWTSIRPQLADMRRSDAPILKQLRIKLYPDSLGEVDVTLQKDGRGMRVQLDASLETTASELRRGRDELAAALTQLGFDVSDLSIEISTSAQMDARNDVSSGRDWQQNRADTGQQDGPARQDDRRRERQPYEGRNEDAEGNRTTARGNTAAGRKRGIYI